MQSWSLIVICYNEQKNIIPFLNKALNVIKKLSSEKWEIIIVDDGSNDGSNSLIKEYIKTKDKIKLYTHGKNYGIGKAIKTGIENCNNENITIIPSDNQFDVNELLKFKFIPPKTIYSLYRQKKYKSAKRNLLSFFNRLIIKIFFGYKIKDINWIIIFKKNELLKIKLNLESSLIMTEVVIKMLKNKCVLKQFPSKYYKRKYGLSKGASFKIVSKAFLEIIALYKEINFKE